MRESMVRGNVVPDRFWAGMVGIGLMAATADARAADYGFKWSGKKEAAPAVKIAEPRNGFVTAIHKLQEDAKRQAFDGDIDGAIANAQRARKIAEASSALVAEDPECTIEAADRLVEKLVAIKASARPPAKPGFPTLFARKTATAPSISAPPIVKAAPTTRAAVPSWQRPQAVFSPSPLPMVAQPLPAVAGGWNATPEPLQLSDSLDKSPVEEIFQSDERTLALLMARETPQFSSRIPAVEQSPASRPQPSATDEVRTEPTEMPQTDSAREFVTAVDSASVDTSFLQVIETGSSTATIQSVAASATVLDQPITNASAGVLEQSIHHASLSEEAEHSQTAVEPIGYAGSVSNAEEALAVTPEISVPTVFIREVEPAEAVTPAVVKPERPAANIAERLARWTRLPGGFVAVVLAGIGLILLSVGVYMARSVIKAAP